MAKKTYSSILALDLGTTTGWAFRDENNLIATGTMSFKNSRYEGGGMRYLRFTNFISELNSSNNISQIYFEEVRRHQGVDAAHVYGGFLAHLTAWCEKNNVPYAGVPVGTIKKFATGKGNANKTMMIEAAKKSGFAPLDDNEADAIAILHWAMDQLGEYK